MDNLNHLPFQKVMQIYQQKIRVENANNIAARTRLLRLYPELFNKEIFNELTRINKACKQIMKNHSPRLH